MVTKRRMLHQAREKKILDSARELFIARGYQNITIRDIAAGAGLTRRTVYAYFPTKEELMMTLHLNGLIKRVEVLENALEKKKTGIEKIRAFGLAYYGHYKKNPDQLLLQVILDAEKLDDTKISSSLLSRFRLANAEGHRTLEEALALGKRDGTISSKIDVKLYFVYLVFTFRAVAKQTLFPTLSPVNKYGEKFYYDYLKLILKALKPNSKIR